MSLLTDWKKFCEVTKNGPPRWVLVKALEFVKNRDIVLDLGAGALNDTRYLLAEGFKQVFAVDKELVASAIAEEFPKERFQYLASSMEQYEFPVEMFDLVSAQYVLPFMREESVALVVGKIRHSLKSGGIFVGQLFGDRDEWVGSINMNFHTQEETEKILSDFDVLFFKEDEEDRLTAAGIIKHWHVFHFIARK